MSLLGNENSTSALMVNILSFIIIIIVIIFSLMTAHIMRRLSYLQAAVLLAGTL